MNTSLLVEKACFNNNNNNKFEYYACNAAHCTVLVWVTKLTGHVYKMPLKYKFKLE